VEGTAAASSHADNGALVPSGPPCQHWVGRQASQLPPHPQPHPVTQNHLNHKRASSQGSFTCWVIKGLNTDTYQEAENPVGPTQPPRTRLTNARLPPEPYVQNVPTFQQARLSLAKRRLARACQQNKVRYTGHWTGGTTRDDGYC
jgi:hypothetical protein